jgi:hypothetical protein
MRNLPGRRAIAAAVLTPVLILGATACTGDDKKPESADATPTKAAPTGKTIEDPGPIFDAMEAAMAAAKSANVHMDLGTSSAEGPMTFGDGRPAMELQMSSGETDATKFTMRYVGGQMYVNYPGLTAPGKFIKIEKGDSTLGDLDPQGYLDLSPANTAKSIREALERMGEVGHEKIDGSDTTHYSLTVHTADGSEDLTYQIYVTDDDLMRRVVMTIPGGKIPLQIDYTGWGEQKPIGVPAKADLIKLPKTQ